MIARYAAKIITEPAKIITEHAKILFACSAMIYSSLALWRAIHRLQRPCVGRRAAQRAADLFAMKWRDYTPTSDAGSDEANETPTGSRGAWT